MLLIKIQFSLAYRALEGFVRSLGRFANKEWSIPTYSTICKRAKHLENLLLKLSHRRPHVLLIDASGLKILGEGEWKRKIHGIGRPRKWLKLHLAVDEKTQKIVAQRITDKDTADSTGAPHLLEKLPASVKQLKADGAYDRAAVRCAAEKQGMSTLIPPPRNAVVNGKYCERDNSVKIIKGLGVI